jgi:hypothetical protein
VLTEGLSGLRIAARHQRRQLPVLDLALESQVLRAAPKPPARRLAATPGWLWTSRFSFT